MKLRPSRLTASVLLLLVTLTLLNLADSREAAEDAPGEMVVYVEQELRVLPPRMKKWPPNLDYPACEQYLDGTWPAWRRVSGRLRFKDEMAGDFGTTCRDVHDRGYYPDEPLSEEEAHYPIAFATIAYKDYAMLERVLNVMYQPQNLYCYVIDSKAPQRFKQRLRDLARCFPNVMVAAKEFDVQSSGINTSAAHLACMRALKPFKWNYLVLLQNHDFPLRTNAEMVRIFKTFNGTNDISTSRPTATSFDKMADTSLPHLHLYRNDSRNLQLYKDKYQRLRLTKSLVGVSLSRPFVKWLLDELDVSGFIKQLEMVYYGMDENFLSTLNSNDLLGAPGGFTMACVDRGLAVGSVSRYAVWANEVSAYPQTVHCGARNEAWRFRHSVCIFGLEDLHRLSQRHELFGNKFMPSFDYGAAMCWLEHMYNRTHYGDTPSKLDPELYAQLPHVRFHKMRTALQKGERWNKYAFDCRTPRQFTYGWSGQ